MIKNGSTIPNLHSQNYASGLKHQGRQLMSSLIFIDRDIVDSTIEEHGGSLVKKRHKTNKEVSGGISNLIPNISAKVSEQDEIEPLNSFEKIRLLQELLQNKKLLSLSRPADKHEKYYYVLERCSAYKVVVPSTRLPDKDSPALSMWISEKNDGVPGAGTIFLFEGRGGDKAGTFHGGYISAYSAMQSVLHFAREQNRIGILINLLPRKGTMNHAGIEDEAHPQSAYEVGRWLESAEARKFIENPLRVLRDVGCTVCDTRSIEVLYQLREYAPESSYGYDAGMRISSFGYALYVRTYM
jgi:hypothetical protein